MTGTGCRRSTCRYRNVRGGKTQRPRPAKADVLGSRAVFATSAETSLFESRLIDLFATEVNDGISVQLVPFGDDLIPSTFRCSMPSKNIGMRSIQFTVCSDH